MNARAVSVIELFLVFFFGIRKNRKRLPDEQCIVIANHNSSLDTYVLASLFSWRHKNRTRVAAAKDTFAGGFAGWVAQKTLQVILVDRAPVGAHDPLAEVKQLLREGNSLIIYPEGTRGEPGKIEEFKRGIGVLAAEFPDLPVYPVFIKGVEKCLARDEYLLVPFEIHIKVAENPVRGREFLKDGANKREASKEITKALEQKVCALGAV
ncbi:MAG: 1-acyl-sn-glycerol-3-phosphate acyltransferase [Kiritimatiellae bacterium]|nr:1-acyl-sn-glycerol-3-phosphate acyltransferase [Kiritimatiellia bacterium]